MLEHGYLEFLAPDRRTRPTRSACAPRCSAIPACTCAASARRTPKASTAGWAIMGLSPLPVVNLAAGNRRKNRSRKFNVVRAAPEKMPEGRIQFVQHLTPGSHLAAAVPGPHQQRREARLRVRRRGRPGRGRRALGALRRAAAAARRRLRAPAGRARPRADRQRAKAGRALLGDAPAAPALAGYALECRDPAILRFALQAARARAAENCGKICTRYRCPQRWAAPGFSEPDKDWDCPHEKRPLRPLRHRAARAVPEEEAFSRGGDARRAGANREAQSGPERVLPCR